MEIAFFFAVLVAVILLIVLINALIGISEFKVELRNARQGTDSWKKQSESYRQSAYSMRENNRKMKERLREIGAWLDQPENIIVPVPDDEEAF